MGDLILHADRTPHRPNGFPALRSTLVMKAYGSNQGSGVIVPRTDSPQSANRRGGGVSPQPLFNPYSCTFLKIKKTMSCIHMHFFINRTNPKSVCLHVHTSAGSVHAPESIFGILVKRDYQTHSDPKVFIWSLPALIRAHATSLVTPLYEVKKSPARPARLLLIYTNLREYDSRHTQFDVYSHTCDIPVYTVVRHPEKENQLE